MKRKRVSIIRENDDHLAKTRVSLGDLDTGDFYIVFRGDPEDVVSLLKDSLKIARVALPAEKYQDHRRPQG